MGRVAWTQRIAFQAMIEELRDYARAMPKEDREELVEMARTGLKHVGAASNAASLDVWALLLISIQLEHHKKLKELEDALAHRRVPQR